MPSSAHAPDVARDEPEPELAEADLEIAMAERGLEFAPGDRQAVLADARFLQRAVLRVRRFESDTDEASS